MTDDLLDAVRRMRAAQRAYYADPNRSTAKLTVAKKWEAHVDKLLRAIDLAKRQPGLPFDGAE